MRPVRWSPARALALVAMVLGVHCASPSTRREEPKTEAVASAATWDSALPPIRIRTGHTTTLLGTGEVLVAGGDGTARSTELIDPLGGKVSVGPELVEDRSDHTATLLLSGKVLLAGGTDTATAELYDPTTRTSVATGKMSKPRRGHVAVRLRSGKVIVFGGGDSTNEIYDPGTGTWAPAPDRRASGVAAAVTLADGRILVAGDATGANTLELFDPTGANGAGSWSLPQNVLPSAFGTRTFTRLHDGRVVIAWTGSCGTTGGPVTCDTQIAVFNPANGTLANGPDFQHGRDAFSAARLPGGQVIFIGGEPRQTLRRIERFDPPSPASLASDGDLTAAHVGATSTVLAGGDVLTIGGSQATIARRVTHGRWRTPPALVMTKGRKQHAAARLHDGTILVSGGIGSELDPAFTGREADVVDVAAGAVTATSPMTQTRAGHTMTTLRSGRVLVAGGGVASAEIYDPAVVEGLRFKAVGAMTTARTNHAATLLPSGHVLVTGGDAVGTAAELFDPATSSFTALPPMTEKRSKHGAVLMGNGLVLVVGGGTAELFDPVSKTFRTTSPPGAARDGRTARLLANGKVFVTGGETLAADMFDPATETWSFTAPQTAQFPEILWATLPDGRLVSAGGRQPVSGSLSFPLLFDPLASSAGAIVQLPTAPHSTFENTVTLAGTGEVVAMGGEVCWGNCTPQASQTKISVYGDDAPEAARPAITQAPATATAGSKVTIAGTGFANGAEASDGRRGSSPVNHPTAVWVSDAGDAVVRSTIVDFTDTSATWLVPTTAHHGHGMLFVSVAGVLSRGVSVAIEPAPAAVACAFDVECSTGFCVDGVCCDRRCDGICEGCSKARKTSGEDGVCGPVPPGKDITGRCVLKLGDACTAKEECGPNFCAQGVCCDSACEGQCLACNQPGQVGKCSAVNEGQCGAACDGDHTLKQVGAPDVDCAPFKCEGPRCRDTCASVRDCVAPAVCSLEGQCVPPAAPSPSDDAVCGCRAAGARREKTGALAALGAFAMLAWRRRRPERRAR